MLAPTSSDPRIECPVCQSPMYFCCRYSHLHLVFSSGQLLEFLCHFFTGFPEYVHFSAQFVASHSDVSRFELYHRSGVLLQIHLLFRKLQRSVFQHGAIFTGSFLIATSPGMCILGAMVLRAVLTSWWQFMSVISNFPGLETGDMYYLSPHHVYLCALLVLVGAVDLSS